MGVYGNMRVKQYRRFVGDFETTVYDGQKSTEVWASAIVEIGSEDVIVLHSIDETFEYLVSLNTNVIIYYHNLKFDGSFWLSFLMINMGLQQAYEKLGDEITQVAWLKDKDMPNKSFKYSISDRGQWYTIIIKYNNHYIEIRDSLKLLPFSVKRIGESFGTKHKKLDMDYKGFRYAGCEITKEEQEYTKNDVLVVKEALEIMFEQGHTDLTIGSCCLNEFKRIIGKDEYNTLFPNMYDIPLDESYGSPNVGEYLRKSYKGGWCYLVKGKEGKIYHNGTTADVNSLYPSMMSSESGNIYPYGKPYFWKGDFVHEQALKQGRFYYIRVRTRFYLKDGMLPFIQIKDNFIYDGTECLATSDMYDKETGKYYQYYMDENNERQPYDVVLTLSMVDWELIKEHYHLVDTEILDGCWFFAMKGIFDQYIEKYKQLKLTSKGALRELAKLFLNNLYGKLASSTESSFKLAYIKDDQSLGFVAVLENNKTPGYIPCGAAITSYARNFTIRTAQKNYHGIGQRGFIYADTDSIHCDLEPSEIVGIVAHDKNFCCWKLESQWDEAIFTRQKTYIEHITHENLEPIEEPYYNVKCAGMPKKSKDLFITSLQGYESSEEDSYTQEEVQFISQKRELTNFDIGLKVPGKLMPKRVKGGILLVDTTYEMR